MRIAVLGAGLAGIACARRLVAAGLDVVLFDKGRAAGGRVATRRAEGLSFDHGAQYLRAEGTDFAEALRQAGAAEWPAAGGLVGVPTMSAVPRGLAAGLELRAARHVLALRRQADGWRVLHGEAGLVRVGGPQAASEPLDEGPFDAVLCTLPAPQAAPLLSPVAPALAEAAASVPFAPAGR
ncbi:MAG: FAD-dependent oxidoreductase [Acetobacteraceae bacterium]|nr:FAD-dependent oxidoreductase [Acetobacteraceae bacterium]MDW8398546.1 FAD-dependent oxidoreductase [Acetobacteraceae bacterium]